MVECFIKLFKGYRSFENVINLYKQRVMNIKYICSGIQAALQKRTLKEQEESVARQEAIRRS